MKRDAQRVEFAQAAMREHSMDGLVCGLPHHVLLLSGYWPVTAASWVVFTRHGHIVLLVPEDEQEFAQEGYADEVRTFRPSSLQDLRSVRDSVHRPLSELLKHVGLDGSAALGYEDDEASVPVTYSALHVFGAATRNVIAEAGPRAKLLPGSAVLQGLLSRMTPDELERVRDACEIVSAAFLKGVKSLRSGLIETEAAHAFHRFLGGSTKDGKRNQRAGGFVWCMSGPNAALAGAAYARTGDRRLEPGDLVLIHCNSYVGGYWTDVTRTFCLGQPDQRKVAMYTAVFQAHQAALDAIRPGATGAEIDYAAREVLRLHGFEKEFTHGTGHGVGYAAISPEARPRLHPMSGDVLEPGMVFNVEPAVYLPGYAGLRQCSMVGVGPTGAELLTPMQRQLDELVIQH